MSISCIALDLDGTTLFDHNTLTGRTRRALEQAAARGIHIVVASGRCFDSLPSCITELPVIRYAITSNGAAVYEIPKRCIKRFAIPQAAVDAIEQIAHAAETPLELFYNGGAYASARFLSDPTAYGVPPTSVRYLQSTRSPLSDVDAFLHAHRHELDSIDLLVRHPDDFAPLCAKIQTEIPDIYITSSAANRIEISSHQAGKHNGLAFLLRQLDIPPAEAAAFGDADNDIDMLRYVEHGLAVENATARCKAAASRIVPANTADGVAEGIKWLLRL